MKKLNYLFLLLLVSTTLPAFAQQENTPQKMQIGLRAGSMVAMSNKQAAFSTYLNPVLTYQWKPRVQLHGGLMYVNYRMPGVMQSEQRPFQRKQALFVNAGATAFVTNRLSLTGEVYYGISQPMHTGYGQFDSRRFSMLMSAEYKISESVRIQTSVQISKGANPYGMSPFGFNNFYPSSLIQGAANPIHQRGASW